MKFLIILTQLLFFTVMAQNTGNNNKLNELIKNGEFKKAESIIAGELASGRLSPQEIYNYNFYTDLMFRIERDFTKTEDDVLAWLAKYYPGIKSADLEKWEKDGSLEMRKINGVKKYFKNGARNLFRINKEAKKRFIEVEGNEPRELDNFLAELLPQLLKESAASGKSSVMPIDFTIRYTLTVKPDVIPAGEVLRVWLPYPREIKGRQENVTFISANRSNPVIAPSDRLQRTIYLEAVAEAGKPTLFEASYSFRGYSIVSGIDFSKTHTIDPLSEAFKNHTGERAPHIVYTDALKNLNAQITAGVTDPALKAKKIYEWINDNIPWASALEYSTIPNISSYCYENMHGDCGIQTLLFMTLCRMNGIPARWQSGWMLHPPEVNLHDWCEIYFDQTGWVPVDQSFKLQKSDDPQVRYFFLGNIDAYHFVVNDDYSQELFPAKTYPRSETVDFQRGEVEWKAGNLYFNNWNYDINIDYKKADK